MYIFMLILKRTLYENIIFIQIALPCGTDSLIQLTNHGPQDFFCFITATIHVLEIMIQKQMCIKLKQSNRFLISCKFKPYKVY